MLNPVDAVNNNEPLVIRYWSKTKLYNHLAETYFLPSKDSRGVNRQYLVAVFQDTVLRIRRTEILEFEVRLTGNETKKGPFYSVALLYERTNNFVLELGFQPLGFSMITLPEEEWFSRLLRYVDPANVLEGFLSRVANAPEPPVFASRA